jgi:D-glycero-D-manno-heptose 1,7-bisphosphate phosphatase
MSSAPDKEAEGDRVVILDRDGTIVVDRNYLADPQGLQFLPGAAEGLRRLHQDGYRLVVISNQSGVGRGLFSLERLQHINARLAQMVSAAGARIDGIYCCPHRPDEHCDCRKPQTGLLQQAAHELRFDPRKAFVVGDKGSDIELGRRVGATTVLISTHAHHGGRHGGKHSQEPAPLAADYAAADLQEAAQIIERLQAARLEARRLEADRG